MVKPSNSQFAPEIFRENCEYTDKKTTDNLLWYECFRLAQLESEFTDGYEMTPIAYRGMVEVPYCFSRSSVKVYGLTNPKIYDLGLIWARLLGRSQLPNSSDLACYFGHYLINECISCGFLGVGLFRVGRLVVDMAQEILVWKGIHRRNCLLKHSLYSML